MFFVFLYLGKADKVAAPNGVSNIRLELLLLFFLPPFEIALSFLRRIIKNKSPFIADRGHLHYLLKEKGLSTTAAVLVLCLLHFVFCILFFYLISVF
jgi:UDP-GlcNAc:undecaprenyl-phosphate GlcNAc-1-phosphate transferase